MASSVRRVILFLRLLAVAARRAPTVAEDALRLAAGCSSALRRASLATRGALRAATGAAAAVEASVRGAMVARDLVAAVLLYVLLLVELGWWLPRLLVTVAAVLETAAAQVLRARAVALSCGRWGNHSVTALHEKGRRYSSWVAACRALLLRGRDHVSEAFRPALKIVNSVALVAQRTMLYVNQWITS